MTDTAEQKGHQRLWIDATRHRVDLAAGGMTQSSGRDDLGLWEVGEAGVSLRLRREEGRSILFDSWFWRRQYINDAGMASISCSLDNGRPAATIRFPHRDLGSPELTFDLETASLVRFSRLDTGGSKSVTIMQSWSEPDAQRIRWPTKIEDVSPVTGTTVLTVTKNEPGLACSKSDCLAPANSFATVQWPAKKAQVRVPMRLYLDQVSLRIRVGSKEVWALLDSGAGITTVDSQSSAVAEFKPTGQALMHGATQSFASGLGELPTLSVGGLTFEHTPTVSIPSPGLSAYGARRPEVVLGFSLFLSTAVRIDYAKSEVVFAKQAQSLVSKDAASLPMSVIAGGLVSQATLEGRSGLFILDTGCSRGFALFQNWTSQKGLPGNSHTVELHAITGAGSQAATETIFRVSQAILGPIQARDIPVSRVLSPVSGLRSGMVGNPVFSSCKAIVFDVPNRTLWMEGPCDRPVQENKAQWRLRRQEDPKFPNRPWVVQLVFPGGSAERGGVLPGDRLLEVADKPAGLDVPSFDRPFFQPDGSRVPLSVDRGGETKKLLVELRRVALP